MKITWPKRKKVSGPKGMNTVWEEGRPQHEFTRECECGEPTDREGLCDECTGHIREFCGFCGRDDLRGIWAQTGERIAPRHKANGRWCFGASSILEVKN